MGAKTLRYLLLVLGLALLAAPAAGVDTWEPYPMGPSTLEFYGTRYGQGAEEDALKGYAVSGGPVWGVSPRTHAYLWLGLSNSDVHTGGLDFLSLGVFSNIYNGNILDLDLYAQLDALAPGLSSSARLAGFESNIDLRRWGLFARTTWSWESEGENEDGEALTGRRALFTYGAYIALSSKVQILGEILQENPSGFVNEVNGNRTSSWALGYNRQLSEQLEVIFEARAHEPRADEDRIWDFTLGIVTVW